MATENNKNLKYTSPESIRPVRKKLKENTSINAIKNIFNQFITAVKNKHM